MSSILVLPNLCRDTYYYRNRPFTHKGSDSAANRRTLVTPSYAEINITDMDYYLSSARELDLNSASSWDTQSPTDYTVAANRAGKDFYVYACKPSSGSTPVILISAASTWPTGYSATTSRKIAGFHCVPDNCVNLSSGHPYKDFLVGDILFNSIWDLSDRPAAVTPEGMAKISLTPWDGKPALWVDIYLFSGDGTTCTSVFGATIQDTKDWMTFNDYAKLQRKRLLRDAEFQDAATGSNEQTNIAGSADPGTVTFPVDTAGRSMISNYGIIGMCGIMWQWLDEQSYRLDSDGSVSAASKTVNVTHVASPGGNPIYIKFFNDGTPYLCCNMANDGVDKVITLGTDYKLMIKHDAGAATGGLQIYFDDDGTQPARILCNNTLLGKNCYVATNNPDFSLQITHNTNAATVGVPVYYDDATDERLEATLPSGASQAIDLCISPGWGYYTLPGSKGSEYKQGSYGDVKLLAGGNWTDAAYCGSRNRNANNYRWAAASTVGSRAAADPMR